MVWPAITVHWCANGCGTKVHRFGIFCNECSVANKTCKCWRCGNTERTAEGWCAICCPSQVWTCKCGNTTENTSKVCGRCTLLAEATAIPSEIFQPVHGAKSRPPPKLDPYDHEPPKPTTNFVMLRVGDKRCSRCRKDLPRGTVVRLVDVTTVKRRTSTGTKVCGHNMKNFECADCAARTLLPLLDEYYAWQDRKAKESDR